MKHCCRSKEESQVLSFIGTDERTAEGSLLDCVPPCSCQLGEYKDAESCLCAYKSQPKSLHLLRGKASCYAVRRSSLRDSTCLKKVMGCLPSVINYIPRIKPVLVSTQCVTGYTADNLFMCSLTNYSA